MKLRCQECGHPLALTRFASGATNGLFALPWKGKELRASKAHPPPVPPCSYIPCSERIHVAVTEMAALFPKVSLSSWVWGRAGFWAG